MSLWKDRVSSAQRLKRSKGCFNNLPMGDCSGLMVSRLSTIDRKVSVSWFSQVDSSTLRVVFSRLRPLSEVVRVELLSFPTQISCEFISDGRSSLARRSLQRWSEGHVSQYLWKSFAKACDSISRFLKRKLLPHVEVCRLARYARKVLLARQTLNRCFLWDHDFIFSLLLSNNRELVDN